MKERKDSLQKARSQEFDLLIIGGGIAGAAIAQNASARGLSVLLIEQSDLASGASSKTNQLLNGSLPGNLEQLDISFKKQNTEEHERLRRLAPHLIKKQSFVLPLTRNNTFFNIKARVGLKLYDVLTLSAKNKNTGAYLDKQKLANLVPALSPDVSGGIQFNDAIIDDARMVTSVLKAAAARGACIVNYLKATEFRLSDGKITSVKCHDCYSGEEFWVNCKACINASGVWLDEVCSMLGQQNQKLIQLRKSTQIIVASSAFETNSAVFLPTKDGRLIHVSPWQHALIIGSCESSYTGDLSQARSSDDEIAYLLDSVNSHTKSQKLSAIDVKASFAGLQAQAISDSTGTSKSTTSNDYWIFDSAGEMLSVVLNKFGSYRLMAEEVISKLSSKFPQISKYRSSTDQEMLGGWENKDDFIASSAAIEIKAKRLAIEPASIQHLISNYGKEAEDLVDLIEQKPELKERIVPDFPAIMAEVPYSVIGEMAVSLQDFFFRRTRLATLNQRQAMEAAPRVAALMGQILNWDNNRSKLELSALETEIFDYKEEAKPVSI